MDIQHLVDRLEDLIDEGRHVWFSKFTLIDEERALEIIDQMRISVPEQIEIERLVPVMTIESNEAIKEAVAAGLGIGIVSRHTLTHTAPGNLVELDVEGFPIPNSWFLVHWRGKQLSPVAEAFRSFALTHAAGATRPGGGRRPAEKVAKAARTAKATAVGRRRPAR